jgi:hypothetical protein
MAQKRLRALDLSFFGKDFKFHVDVEKGHSLQ